jgi:predicted chitinase
MANFTEGLLSLVKDKVLGKSESEISSTPKPSLSTKQLKIISKNFMAMKAMARDLNVASQNIKELVKVMGGKPSNKEDKVAGGGLTEEEREKKLEVLVQQEQKADELKPTKVEKKSEAFFEKMKKKGVESVDKFKKSKVGKKAVDLKKQFSENKFIKAFQKYFAIAAIVGILFLAFKDTIIEWAKGLYDTIKEKFTEFIDDIKNWFDETVKKVVDGVKEFFNTVIEKISSFFEGIGNWFVEKFETIKSIFEPVLSFIQKVWDKFMGLLDGLKTKIKPVVEGAMKWSGKDGKITKMIQSIGLDKFLGIGQTEEKKVEQSEDDAEKKKLERQQKEALDTERVRKQEEEKKYKGKDEIVRERHGIEDKTMTMRAEEAKKEKPAPKGALTTTEGAPVVSGTGEVVMTGESEPGVAPVLDQTAAETKRLQEKEAATRKVKPTPAPKPEVKPAPKVEAKPTPAPAPAPKPSETQPSAVSGDAASQIVSELNNSGITSKRAQANILAQVAKESNFKPINEELGKWSAQTLFRLYGPPGASYTDSKGKPATVPQHKNKVRFQTWDSAVELVKKGPEAIGDVVYGGRMGNNAAGDGFKYRGRGYIQLTGKDAYDKIGKILGINLVSDPDQVNNPSIAAKIVPAFFLKFKGKKPEDLEDINSVNKLVGAADPKSQEARVKLAGDFESRLQSGQSIGTSSTQVASGQRQQQKPSTPVIVNAPTTNTTVVNNKQVASAPLPKDSSRALVSRAA